MFGKIAGFEFRYQLRQPIFWIAVFFFGVGSFGSVASSNIHIGSSDNIHKNASFVIGQTSLIMSVIFMFATAAFVSNVIVRDDETGYGPLIRSTPLRKFDYLFGRFLGAFAAVALAFVSAPLGLWVGSIAPWVDPDTIGPFASAPYLYGYFVLALPFLFLSAALFFTLTTTTRSMMWTYIGVIGLMVFRSVFGVLTSKPGLEHVASLWDPFGAAAFGVATRYWTASERNVLLPAIQGDFLLNKLIWTAFGAGVLAAAYPLFDFKASGAPARARKAAALDAEPSEAAAAVPASGLAKPRFDRAATWAQLLARTRLDALQVFGSPAFFVLLGLAAGLSVINLWLATDVATYGGRIFPVSRVMMQALGGAFTFMSLIIAIYYAGELVWRERERRTHEIIDATPVPDWIFIVPKTAAIAVVLFATTLVSVAVAMIIQAIKGYYGFEIDKYLLWYVLPNAIDVTLFAVLAMFVQALSPHKFIGWAVMATYLISTIVLSNLGFEDNLYQYVGSPDVPLSDMNRMGHYWIGAYWFRLYWIAFAGILLVLAYGLWRRGTEVRFAPRLRRLPARLNGPAGLVGAAALLVFVAVGAYIFVNTHVWNPYRTKLGDEKWSADYEKAFLRYETLPQPKVAKVTLAAQIYPHHTRVDVQGRYLIQNRTGAPISVLHVRFDRDLKVNSLAVEGARLQSAYPLYNYRIYRFERPMQPGETRSISFDTTRAQTGFRNSGNIVDIMDNGTFVNDGELTPIIGMDRSNLLQDRTRRRKYGLVPELRMPKLGTAGATDVNYGRHDSDWVTTDFLVTTDADQTPVAPGYKVSDVVKGGRRTIHFVGDSPVMNFSSIQSAKFAVASDRYKGVDLSVYYDPQHPWNVQRIIRGMKASLDYFQANFSPYQFHQARVLEFPVPQGSFAESFANTIPWSEGIFFIADNRDPDRIDMVTYVGAHEMAHQWWGHQVIGADEQGSTLLSETLAQYSAAMVMKHMYGPDMMRKFLKFELDRYLRDRGGEVLEEEPIERVEGQSYIRYRKGSLVMYRLQDEIGEEAVNRALRHLIHDFAFKGPPYPTALDLVKDLRQEAPADKQALITDLFEKITLYDVKTTAASAHKRADGRYDLTLSVDAKKLYADGQGREHPSPMAESLDVGAFDVEPAKPGYGLKNVIGVERRPIHTGVQTLQLVVNRLPKFAGVDPYNKLIDRNSEDNIAAVTVR
jgi:ABC-2 type transport system permease protein